MKESLLNLVNQNKIVVGVYQDRNEQKKMELVNIWENETTNMLQLTAFLYRKTIQKSTNIKIRYSYNYTDKQVIEIIESYTNYDNTVTKTKFVFYNIPTNMGYLDITKLENKIKNEKE